MRISTKVVLPPPPQQTRPPPIPRQSSRRKNRRIRRRTSDRSARTREAVITKWWRACPTPNLRESAFARAAITWPRTPTTRKRRRNNRRRVAARACNSCSPRNEHDRRTGAGRGQGQCVVCCQHLRACVMFGLFFSQTSLFPFFSRRFSWQRQVLYCAWHRISVLFCSQSFAIYARRPFLCETFRTRQRRHFLLSGDCSVTIVLFILTASRQSARCSCCEALVALQYEVSSLLLLPTRKLASAAHQKACFCCPPDVNLLLQSNEYW